MRAWEWIAAGIVLTGCASAGVPRFDGGDGGTQPSVALASAYGGHGRDLLDRPSRIERTAGRLEIRRGVSEAPAEGSHETLRLPLDARDALELRLAGRVSLRAVEEGAEGPSERVDGAVSYAREGGRSYWTVADGRGFEEWLAIEEGRAFADRALARWRVEGHALREVSERGGVHVLGADGAPIAYVSAPAAWTMAGERVDARLAPEDGAIALFVDADGAPVLADPLWVATGVMTTPREESGAVRLAGEGVLIAGGSDGAAGLATAERYDPATGVWSGTGPMAEVRGAHTTTLLASGRVLVTGGIGVTPPRFLASAEVYDDATGTWSGTGPLSAQRGTHTATLLASGQVLVAGGSGSVFSMYSCELYDPATGTWSDTGALAFGRQLHTATLLPGGQVLVAGGLAQPATGGGGRFDETAELYDPSSRTWSMTGSMATRRYHHRATLLASGRVLVTGGVDGTSDLRTAELYDPVSGTWTSAGSMNEARSLHAVVLLSDGRVLVAGGTSGGATTSSTAELYDPSTGTWSSAGAMTTDRMRPSAALLSGGDVLIAGGYSWSLRLTTGTSELFLPGSCGDGVVDRGDACDGGECCTPDCFFAPATTVCRPAIGECDVAETCTGSSSICPSDDLAVPPGTACGPSPSGACDAPDVCEGMLGATATCIAIFETPTTACRPSVDACDVAEVCTGVSSECPPDAAPVTGCCLEDIACDDADDCTVDSCDAAAHTCAFTPIDGCGRDAGVDAGAADLDAGAEDAGRHDAAGAGADAGADAGPEAPDSGCGCRTGGGEAPTLAWLLLPFACVRRRRQNVDRV